MTKKNSPKNKKSKGLSLPHKKFCEEYLLDWNATRAYQEIFKTKAKRTAEVNASKLLRKTECQEYIKKRVDERNKALRIDQHYVVEKAKEIVEADYVENIQYMTRNELENLPKAIRKLITSVQVKTSGRKTTKHDMYEDVETIQDDYETEVKVTFMSKDKAHDLLAKHTGTFLKDNVQINLDKKGFADALADLDI